MNSKFLFTAVGLLGLVLLAATLVEVIPRVVRSNLAMIALVETIIPLEEDMIAIEIPREQAEALERAFIVQNRSIEASPLLAYHLAQLEYWSGNSVNAINYLELADDDLVSPFKSLLLGHINWNSGEIEKAVEAWRSDPRIRHYFRNQAIHAENSQEFDHVEINLHKAISIEPDWELAQAGYWFGRSMHLMEGNEIDYSELYEAAEKAINLNPTSGRRQLWLGRGLMYANVLDLAEIALHNAADLEPNIYWPSYYLGITYFRMQNYYSSIRHFTRALEIAPDFGHAHFHLARSLIRIGEDNNALSHLRIAVQLTPDNPSFLTELESLETRLDLNEP